MGENEGGEFMEIGVLPADGEKEFVEVLAERLEARDFSIPKAFSGNEPRGLPLENRRRTVDGAKLAHLLSERSRDGHECCLDAHPGNRPWTVWPLFGMDIVLK
jgi:hypothetical protein